MCGRRPIDPHGCLLWMLMLVWIGDPASFCRGQDANTLEEPGDWPSSRHDSGNRASTQINTKPVEFPRTWTFSTNRQVFGFKPGMTVWSSAAIGLVGGRAVVAVGNYDHNVYLLDACSGEQIWRFTTGNGVYGSPILWHQGGRGWLFVSSSDRLVYALDAELGNRIWSVAVEKYEPSLGGAWLSSPTLGRVAGEAALFVGHWVWDKTLSHSVQIGGVTALDAQSGKILWRKDFLDNRVSAPVFGEVGQKNLIFVSSEDGNLRALWADTGEQIWFIRETGPIMGSPAFFLTEEGGRVVMGSHFGKVRCLDAESGREIWSFKTGNWVTGSPVVFSNGERLMVAVGSYDQRMYGLDARSGEKVWSSPLAGPVYSSAAIIAGEENQVIFSAWDHSIHSVSAQDGELLWSVFTGAPIWDALTLGDSNWSSPAVARINDRWMVYFGSYSGTFYALSQEQAALGGLSRPWSNLSFWIVMGLTMGVTGVLSVWLSRRRAKYRS